ncbi:MAG: APC family permease [Alphaproteobacteria bacterium]|nr:APC family permease [Alphaproteobacteria bacterium]
MPSDTARAMDRTVGLRGAVLLGLGSILGTGVFVSLGLAVGVTGSWAVLALCLAAMLAAFNALSSAELAASHPVSGGTYAYGYRYLGPDFGFGAGLAFLLAKSASAAAAAIGLSGYVLAGLGMDPALTNLVASVVVVAMTGLVVLGLRRANPVNALLVTVTLLVLIILSAMALLSPAGEQVANPTTPFAPASFLEATALLFVAFTGYGRIATLGEEVRSPRRTIPRAIILTLLVSTCLYLAILTGGLNVLGAAQFADATTRTAAPLQAVAARLGAPWLSLLVIVAAVTAMAGVLLNLILGLSRVVLAMGREGDLPLRLGQLDRGGQPLAASLCVGAVIAAMAAFGGLALVWSFSAFTVLVYYAITNLAALRLGPAERLCPPIVPALGLVGCLGLSVWLQPFIILTATAILALALVLRRLLKIRFG